MGIRILLAGSHVAIWEGVSRFLQSQEGLEIVGQARDGRIAVELTRQLVPDIVLMDKEMPTLNGLDALREIHREQRGVRIIFLSSHTAASHVRQTLKAGASGCLPEDCDYETLLAAIRIVADGATYVSPELDCRPQENQKQGT
jgi:DNA-binding NarL/FixJ family response regulator